MLAPSQGFLPQNFDFCFSRILVRQELAIQILLAKWRGINHVKELMNVPQVELHAMDFALSR